MYFRSAKFFLVVLSCCSALSLFAKDAATQFDAKSFKKPVCFVENKGQVTDEQNNARADIKYKLSTPGLNLYLGSNRLLYQFKQTEGTPTTGIKVTGYEMGVALVGANPNAQIINEDKQTYHENYYPAVSGNNGFTAYAYNKITYKNVYPNIDWVVYVKDNNVEYDFVVKPGGNTKDIKIAYQGATALSITKEGRIHAVTPMGVIEEKKPLAYENATGRAVASKFRLAGNIISFETGDYTGSLTIDPYLNWSTYFGGSGDDVATSVTAYGGTGLIYVAGYTSSTTGVSAAVGLPFNTYGGGTYDAFVASYSATGVLAWATYFGGTGTDMGTGITTDGTGNIFLTGYTNSAGIGTVGTYQSAYTAGYDAFLIKFSSLGVRQWSTYFGGAGDDYANTVACDAAGDIYIAGQTSSPATIASAGAFQLALSGTTDGFFAKFTTAGALTFASYFGGAAQDEILGIHCDAAGNFVFTGQTNSISNIATAGAHQIVLNGTNDAFVESFSSLGARNWGTYFGGPGTETGTGITVDGLNNIAIIGNTTSTLNIATANAYQTTFGGVQDAFVVQLTNTGSVTWSTYYGGNSSDFGTSINVDNLNNFGICGYTLSGTGIASTGALQLSSAGNIDGFVAKLDPLGRRFWGTYFGGLFNDNVYGITFDVNDLLTFVGSTGSSSGLYSAGGISSAITVQQPAFGGGTTDGFVTQFKADTIVEIVQPYTDTLVCAGGTLIVNYTTNSILSNVLNVQISDATGVFPALLTSNIIGTTTSTTLAGTITCTIPLGSSGTGYRIRIISTTPSFISPDDFYNIHIISSLPLPTLTANSPICLAQNEQLSVTANYTISSSNWTGPNAFVSAISNPSIVGIIMLDSGMYHVAITHNGCPGVTDSILVKVDSVVPPTPTASVSNPACKNYPVQLYANPGAGAGPFTYYWTGPGGFTSTLQNPTNPDVAGSAAGVYTLIDTLGGCPSLANTVTVVLTTNTTVSISVNVTPNDTVCRGTNISFTTTEINGGPDPVYQWVSATPTDTLVVGGNWNIYSSAYLSDGEKIFCILTSDAACAYPRNDTSNVITVHVIDSTPIAYIMALPDSNIMYGQAVTFMGYGIYPGTISVFQWYVNDTLVPAALAPTFTIPHVTSNIHVKLEVFSPARCAMPDTAFSNTIGIHINTGVNSISSALSNIDLFPNPNKGSFTLNGVLNDYDNAFVTYEITNTVGQIILTDRAEINNNILSKSIDLKNLPDGIYILRINGDGQNKILRFTVQK